MLQDKQAGEEKEEGGHNRQINTSGTREKGPPVFDDTKPGGASRVASPPARARVRELSRSTRRDITCTGPNRKPGLRSSWHAERVLL